MTITDTHATAAPSATDAARHFRAKLSFETDASDVFAAQELGDAFVLVDTRSVSAWDQGHATGAVHIPTAAIADVVPTGYAADTRFVVYCWSPGCNGADRAALALSVLGYEVKLMIGGYEYWAREGYPVTTSLGTVRRPVDELVAPRSSSAAESISCDC